ncbi:wiskott-Aldrich syndrome protein homolog 1-like [Triticum dicoccoides]|uniref:wiskott-Aldrich syndrome protein homolog 1-like n=1 Tax=Triticum dicoccoides TaxID=85692 RepID=UPI001891D172|nr:wiskott-Aldrich syndrome protein homolog 1-like [Triticum dicoccoides]
MDPAAAAARRQADKWMSVAEKLLMAKDLEGCKEFSSQAIAADPRTPGAEDLYAAADVLLASQRRRLPNGKPDPYAVLGLDPAMPASRLPDVVHSKFRRLSLLLNRSHPDRPCSVYVAEAARLVADAWAFLSNAGLKSALDAELDAAAAPRPPMQQPAVERRPHPSPPPQQSPVWAAPQPRPHPQRIPVRPAPQPTPPLQPSSLRAATQTPPPPQSSSLRAATQTPPPPQPSSLRAATQTPPPPQPSRLQPATQPQPSPQPSPLQAATKPPPSPQPSPLQAATKPPPSPQPSPLQPATQPPPPPQPSPLQAASQPPARAATPPVESGTLPASTFWTLCKGCSHIHQYDRLYEARKLKCSSCHQPFVAEAMAEPPPIVPGTDMYYCTWGFFPIGFPGCPGYVDLVNSQPQGSGQLNVPWLGANGRVAAENGTPITIGAAREEPVASEPSPEPLMRTRVEVPLVPEPAPEPLMRMRVGVPAMPEPVMPTRVEVPAAPEPVMPTRVEVPAAPEPVQPTRVKSVKVGAKKRGRPKGSKNKKNLRVVT